jgi:ATP-dependent DNA ligase
MKVKVQLYALTTSGKIKTLIFSTDGDKFITNHGQLDGKMQTSGAEQAVLELKAKMKKKIEEGYSEKMPKEGGVVTNATVDLQNLPDSFCPSKPINSCPAKVENGKDTYGQRKFNGNCLILTKTKIYSRRMKDLTAALKDVPELKATMKAMKDGDMLNTEITFFDKKGKESNRIVGSLVRTKEHDEVMQKHAEYSKEGTFRVNVFDILFEKNQYVGNNDYLMRHTILTARNSFYVPELYSDWKKMIPTAKKEGWEGFVLRVKGDSAVTYTLNGKADRAGCYKYKFMKEGDFVVTEVMKGEAGRHATVYAKFKIGQYWDGELLDCGWAGPGILKQPELEQYTKDIDSGKLKFPFVVEVEFREWQEDSSKLEHPVIQRIRFDKDPEECVYEG